MVATVRPLRSGEDDPSTGTPPEHSAATPPMAALVAVALLAPIAVSALLVPWRGRLTAADSALVLVVVIVAVATAGRRWAAALCALSAAVAFDLLLIPPYLSLRITRSADITTAVLLLTVGLLVGDLAARGRRHRATAQTGRDHLAALHAATEAAATGVGPEEVAHRVADELVRLLGLRNCSWGTEDGTLPAQVLTDGRVRVGTVIWDTADLGLPLRGVDLPVRAGGAVVGHFRLTPASVSPVDRETLQVAVSLVDQVGAAVAGAGAAGPRAVPD